MYESVSENDLVLPTIDDREYKISEYHANLNQFIDGYTNEVLTRRDFRLINNVFSITPITEDALDEMEVANDGVDKHESNRIEFDNKNEDIDLGTIRNQTPNDFKKSTF